MNSNQATNLTFRNATFPTGDTFTQPNASLSYSKISVSFISSIAGSVEIQFSDNMAGTFTSFYNIVIGTTEKYNSLSVRGSYVRYKFTNDTGGEGVISCNTILSQDAGGDNVHNDSIIKRDFSSALVRQHGDFLTDAIIGQYEGLTVRDLHGLVDGLSVQGLRNFWDNASNDLPVITTNRDLYVNSNSVSDSAVGAGMRTGTAEYIYIDGSGNYKKGIQSFSMNGNTNSALGVQGIAVTYAEILSAGNDEVNAGTITFIADMGGGVFRTLNIMPATVGETKLFIGFPQSNENLIITDCTYSGTGQLVAFIYLTKVNIANQVRKRVHKGVNDLANHSGKLHTSINVRGGIEYIIGEISAHTTPPNTENYFNLHARAIYKDNSYII